jgi:hypothetical protein
MRLNTMPPALKLSAPARVVRCASNHQSLPKNERPRNNSQELSAALFMTLAYRLNLSAALAFAKGAC